MFIEIGTSLAAAGLAGYSYLKTKGPAINDGEKIQRIFANCGWNVTESGKLKTARIHRKRKIAGGHEYVIQLPLGLASKTIIEGKHVLEDGLNVRGKVPFELRDLLSVKWDRTALVQIRKLVEGEASKRKEVDVSFDGMLRIKVYDAPIADTFDWTDDLLKGGFKVPVGMDRDNVIYHDFDKLYSLIVAGTPGFGKSQFLKMMITALVSNRPNNVTFTLIDLKEGASFKRFETMKQTKQFADNPESAKEVLKVAQDKMGQMYRKFVGKGFENVQEAGIKERHFIIVDEGADIAQDKECIELLTDLARRGRAAGFYLVYSTQYPTSRTIPMDVKRNIPTRLSFVLDSGMASAAVLDQAGAEDLPMLPGRAIYKHVRCKTVQTPHMTNTQVKERIQPYLKRKGVGGIGRYKENPQQYREGTANRKHSIIVEKV